jgi:hypothetical protein
LDESTAVGTIIYKIEVEDPDTAENSKNSFSFVNGEDGNGTFRLESTGELILMRKLEFDKVGIGAII